jgi:hypothetical protein
MPVGIWIADSPKLPMTDSNRDMQAYPHRKPVSSGMLTQALSAFWQSTAIAKGKEGAAPWIAHSID